MLPPEPRRPRPKPLQELPVVAASRPRAPSSNRTLENDRDREEEGLAGPIRGTVTNWRPSDVPAVGLPRR